MHESAAQAYGAAAKITLSPRELEASLLLKAAARMQALKDDWENLRPTLHDVLFYNRRLWTILVMSATTDDNPLPQEIKNNIGSLGIFVFNQTIETQAKPDPEKLTSLININCEIAAGLQGSTE